ncbi:MAG: alpha/beta hydrolase [Phycisphaerae bacterium]
MKRHNFQNINFNQLGVILILLCMILIPGAMFATEQKQPRISRQQLRQMVKNLAQENDPELRKAKIREIHETYGKPWLKAVTKNTQYQPPGQQGPTTKEYVFKRVPQRQLKIFVDFPPGWKPTDRRAAIVFWHGGGFTQGNAGQFFHQAQYFTKRGLVVARPEYRIRDLDGSLPHEAAEDGISAMRWFKAQAGEFGIDPKRVAAGGGSASGCMASIVGTIDYKQFAELGYVGKQDDRSISPRPCAMILYNPFVDFFEPLNDRHLWEECVMLGRDPFELEPVYHVISAIEHLHRKSPPSIIMFGTKDAFYPQQIRWIVKCRELGLNCHDYVYKGEVHSWYNNSPHVEYTTANVDKFLVEVGLLEEAPKVELPHKVIGAGRTAIQSQKYSKKTDWDEQPRFRRYVEEHNIKLIPFKHYEKKQ